MKVWFFERPLVKYCEMMRKQCVQNLSAIEVYLEVALVDFMLPLDYHREFPLGRRGAHHPYSAVGTYASALSVGDLWTEADLQLSFHWPTPAQQMAIAGQFLLGWLTLCHPAPAAVGRRL